MEGRKARGKRVTFSLTVHIEKHLRMTGRRTGMGRQKSTAETYSFTDTHAFQLQGEQWRKRQPRDTGRYTQKQTQHRDTVTNFPVPLLTINSSENPPDSPYFPDTQALS